MSQNVTDLTSEQNQAIDLLISGKTTGDIAQTLGIHRRTLWRWRQLPAFQQVYRELQTRRQEEMRELTAETLRLTLTALHLEAQHCVEHSWNRLEKAGTLLKLLRNEPLIAPIPHNPESMVSILVEALEGNYSHSP